MKFEQYELNMIADIFDFKSDHETKHECFNKAIVTNQLKIKLMKTLQEVSS